MVPSEATDPMEARERAATRWWPAYRAARGWCLLLVPATLYVASFAGITSSNDGSHYALLRALVETGSPVIDRYWVMTSGIDISVHDGHLYSDRPPGSAVLTAPLYRLGLGLPELWSAVPSRWDAENPYLTWALLGPAVAAWVSAWLAWRLQRRLGVRPGLTLLGCASLLVGSTLWKYGTSLFSHAFSACLVLAATYVLFSVRDWRARSGLLVGALLGASVAVEYQNAAFVGIALAWLAIARRPGWRAAIGVGAGLALTLVPLLAYFKVSFGDWLTTSYAVRLLDPWSREVGSTFSGNILEGLRGLLLANENNTGWLVRMPAVAFGLAGYAIALRRGERDLLLPLATLAFFVVLFSAHVTYHTFTGDGRYLVPYLPLALLPATSFLEHAFGRSRALGSVATVAFAACVLWGALGTMSLLAHSYGTPDVRIPYPVTSWATQFGSDVVVAFRNGANAARFVVLYVAVAAVHVGTCFARERWRERTRSDSAP